VNIALERLVRVGMLEITDGGEWIDLSGGFSSNITEGLTSSASKMFQQQLLEKAIMAIKEVALEKRNNTSMTMAINTKDIPEAKERIKDFRRSMSAFFERTENDAPDEVYNLCIALYPLTISQGE
jgi:uncharacterized protein (TIGR02147 family)